jgi:hypothetical protein
MGYVAVAEDLAGIDDLDELYEMDASEAEPEDEDDDETGDEDDAEDQGGGIKPEEIPHG